LLVGIPSELSLRVVDELIWVRMTTLPFAQRLPLVSGNSTSIEPSSCIWRGLLLEPRPSPIRRLLPWLIRLLLLLPWLLIWRRLAIGLLLVEVKVVDVVLVNLRRSRRRLVRRIRVLGRLVMRLLLDWRLLVLLHVRVLLMRLRSRLLRVGKSSIR